MNVTFSCNNACINCISTSVKKRKELILTTHDLDEVDEYFHLTSDDICNINGGEPTLSPYLERIIKWCRARTSHIILYSNGRLLSSLPSAIIDCLERIIVPLYGDEISHDEYVGVKGAYRETLLSIAPIIEHYPLKIDLKLLISDGDGIINFMSGKDWHLVSGNIHFSITRVLPGYDNNGDCTKRISSIAEGIISKLINDDKIIRYYDIPFCTFTYAFQKSLENIFRNDFFYDPNVIHIKEEGKHKIFNYHMETSYQKLPCDSCSKKGLCVQIMHNYFCPCIKDGICFTCTE